MALDNTHKNTSICSFPTRSDPPKPTKKMEYSIGTNISAPHSCCASLWWIEIPTVWYIGTTIFREAVLPSKSKRKVHWRVLSWTHNKTPHIRQHPSFAFTLSRSPLCMYLHQSSNSVVPRVTAAIDDSISAYRGRAVGDKVTTVVGYRAIAPTNHATSSDPPQKCQTCFITKPCRSVP